MNIVENIALNPGKPAVLPILKTDTLHIRAIGLVQEQLLRKHKTAIPTILTVLKGRISFHINNEIIRLHTYDTFQIPVNIEHEVTGIDAENIFMLTHYQ
jgi:quercetin dioxygenase-like cupin family protein